LALVKAVLRAEHGEQTVATAVSGYYLAGHLGKRGQTTFSAFFRIPLMPKTVVYPRFLPVGRGVPLNMLSKWMGHASLKVTAIHADALGEEQQGIAARMR
jgi:hypothetical protein